MGKTVHLDAESAADLAQAARLLQEGRLVAFATETVYGLGANALSADAVAGIFAAKQRPAWDPLIVHLAAMEQLGDVADIPSHLASRIARLTEAFWPGPLTLLLPRSSAIPDAVTAGRALVGVRIPAHPAAHALLAACGLPVAAPSANRFGHTSPTTAAHVLADLDGRIDAVLDAGPTSIGVESTVLDPTQTPMVVYRPGAVTAADLGSLLGVPVTIQSSLAVDRVPESLPSPGVGIRHYAPRARLVLAGPTPEALWDSAAEQEPGERVGVLLPTGWPPPLAAVAVCGWGLWEDRHALAARLFAGLRALDEGGVDVILCPLPEPGGLGDAVRDRLQKAARAER